MGRSLPDTRLPGDRFLRHFIEAGERRVELADLRSRLAAEEATIMRRAYDRALRFLPPGEYPPPPDVAFVIFGPDARGYVPVVVDILYAAGLGGGLWPLIAHETHHQLVSAVRGLGIGRAGYSRSDLQWVLDQIHLEGVADVVSDLPGTGAVSWLESELPAVPDYLEFLDGQLRVLASHPEKYAEVGSLLRSSLRSAGHPVGFFMATTILNQLGEPVLAGAATDPGEFFAAYLRAARKAGSAPGAGLSEERVKLIPCLVCDEGSPDAGPAVAPAESGEAGGVGR